MEINVVELREYRDRLMKNIEELRQPNGCFRASASPEYCATWNRDSFWCGLSYLDIDNEKYLQTCHTYLDFLLLWEREYDYKISWLAKETVLNGDKSYRFIHPKVNFNGTEIEGLNWAFHQLDSMPYLILMMWFAYERELPVFRNQDDIAIIQLLIKAMEHTEYWHNCLVSSWEEEQAVFLSNMLLCIYATEKAYIMGFDVNREALKKARRKVYGMFPYEREGRDWDLTLLFPCVLPGLLAEIDIEDIVSGTVTNLTRTKYMCRYEGDIYRPFRKEEDILDSEMEWAMSGGYLSIIMSNAGNLEEAYRLIKVVMDDYEDGLVPEGINANGVACFNTPLCWSMSMYAQAITNLLKKLNK